MNIVIVGPIVLVGVLLYFPDETLVIIGSLKPVAE